MSPEIGKRINSFRLKCGLTQQDAAECIGVSRSVYSQIENGEKQVTAEEIGRLAELFHTETDALILGEYVSKPNAADLKWFDLKSVLLNSLQGYLEANLSGNEIIGDVIDKTASGKQVAVNLNAADGRRFTFDAFEQWWAENMLVSSPRQFLEKSNCNWLISCFRNGKKVVDIPCTSRDSEGNQRELKHTYYMSENGNGDIYTICVVSNITDSVYSKQYAEIATDLTESFEGIFYVDTNDDSYVALKTKGAFYNIIQNISGQNFFQSSLKHLRGVVHRDDYRFVADFLKKEYLIEKLKNGNITSMIFRLQVNETEIFYRARVSKSEYDDHHIVFALENVSEFVFNEKIQNEKLMRDKSIIEILASEYSSIYYVDLQANTFEIYKLSSKNAPNHINEESKKLSFSEVYAKCVEEMVYEPDRATMLRAGSIYNILSVLKDRESFTTIYRAKSENGATYCEMKIARVGNEALPRHVVIGFADNSAEKTREIEKAKNISVVLQLANNFEAVYEVDIKTGKYVCYSDSDIFFGERFSNVILSDDIFKGFEEAVDHIVYVDDRPLVKTFLTREYLRDTLTKVPDFQMDFRLLIGGIPTWYHLKAVMSEGSNGQGLILGVFNIEEQRQKEYYHMSEVKRLSQEAHYDLLTGIRNRNAYFFFEKEMDKTMRESKEKLAVAVFDINDLKTVNDQFGHEEGDRLIKKASALVCSTFQHSPVFRIGGDEFVAVLKGKDFVKRKALIETVRGVSKNNIGTDDLVLACGLAERAEEDNCFADIFKRADEAMYQNKKSLKSCL